MKLIILKTNLRDGLAVLDHAVGENANLPVLKNVLIKTQDNKLRLSATNLELGISCSIPGKVIESGGITVPFSTLYSVISGSDAERVSMELDKNNLIVKTDNYRAKIQGVDQSEFPIIPKVESSTPALEISSSVLEEGLSQVIGAAQLSEIRPEISGILFDFQVSALKLVATDSFRLAEKTITAPQWKRASSEGWRIIVPLKTAQEITRVFPEDSTISIFLDQNQIFITNGERELISRLIDGRYPDYEQIIPKSFETELLVERETFAGAVKLVSNFSSRTNDIRFKTQDGTKALEVYSQSQAVGENNYLVPAKVKGPGFDEVVFNWRFILDGLKPLTVKQIMFGVNGASKPAIIRSTDDASLFYIVMPIKSS